MASFCGVCGASTAGGKFCPKCGSPQTPVRATPAPRRVGSPTIKAVFIILAVMLLMGVTGVIGALYWAKGKVEEAARSNGAASLREGAATLRADAAKLREAVSSAANAEPTHAGCDLLSKEKVAALLHAPVARAEGNDAGDIKEFCDYWSNKNDTAQDSKKTSDEPSASSKDGPITIKDLQDLAKNVSASDDAHTPLLEVQVFRGTAKVALLSLKTASLLTGQTEQTPEGPWDEAYFGPFDALLFVRKGNNGLMLKLHRVSDPREKALALAEAMIASI